MVSGLWKSDVFVRDKQNVDAALRILKPEVRHSLSDWDKEKTTATRLYLKLGESIYRAFTERDISVRERSRLAWLPASFFGLWRAWLLIKGYNLDNSFVSQQTYSDVVLSAHPIILSMKVFARFHPTKPHHPWTFGSDSCEKTFSQLRGFCKGKSNLNMMEMIELSGRIQRLHEMKAGGSDIGQSMKDNWPADMDGELIAGMREAEQESLGACDAFGLTADVINGNVIKKIDDTLVLVNPGFNAYDEINALDDPDELDTVDIDDRALITFCFSMQLMKQIMVHYKALSQKLQRHQTPTSHKMSSTVTMTMLILNIGHTLRKGSVL